MSLTSSLGGRGLFLGALIDLGVLGLLVAMWTQPKTSDKHTLSFQTDWGGVFTIGKVGEGPRPAYAPRGARLKNRTSGQSLSLHSNNGWGAIFQVRAEEEELVFGAGEHVTIAGAGWRLPTNTKRGTGWLGRHFDLMAGLLNREAGGDSVALSFEHSDQGEQAHLRLSSSQERAGVAIGIIGSQASVTVDTYIEGTPPESNFLSTTLPQQGLLRVTWGPSGEASATTRLPWSSSGDSSEDG